MRRFLLAVMALGLLLTGCSQEARDAYAAEQAIKAEIENAAKADGLTPANTGSTDLAFDIGSTTAGRIRIKTDPNSPLMHTAWIRFEKRDGEWKFGCVKTGDGEVHVSDFDDDPAIRDQFNRDGKCPV